MRFLSHLFTRIFSGSKSTDYYVYTRSYDRVVTADQLDTLLGPLCDEDRQAHEQAWAAFSTTLVGWRTKAQLHALEADAYIRRVVSDENREGISAAILMDQSGSMRGQSMLLAAAACDMAQNFLVHLGIKTEILGFTTCSWQGGRARKDWLRRGRPSSPGRLCELLHIIYQSSDDLRPSTGSPAFKAMLRPDLPKENVDGEAIEWATARLRAQSSKRKILVVISDGAPVDDSTLAANDTAILARHLKAVISDIQLSNDIDIYGIGINHDTSDYYDKAFKIQSIDDIGFRIIDVLKQSIIK